MNPRRLAVLLCVPVLTATAAALVDQPTAAAEPATSSITVFLKTPNPAALTGLAQHYGLPLTTRLRALRSLVPSDATHADVARTLVADGYRITGQTTWSITAVGARSTSAELFGTRPSGLATPAQVRAATGALPRVPLQLQREVVAAFPTAGGPAPYHHATSTLSGSDFRNAYTPAHATPPSGLHDGKATVATLQLANFYGTSYPDFANSRQAKDLSAYAQNHGISDPVNGPNKRYVAVRVDGGPTYQSGDPDIEVDLDQQSILSTAPSAHQQAYFAPNTNAGYNDVFSRVYDDVVGNKYSKNRNRNIVALSVSWGGCESETGRKAIASLEPILQALTAAGVSVFASSGDGGIYDCARHTYADVDYPASSPYVVGVGGTHLSARANKPNTGRNWTETAWSCTGVYTCRSDYGGRGGSGGGRSGEGTRHNTKFAGFAAPIYQRAGIDRAPFAHNAKRLVPDIAANGAPKSGFRIYSSNPDVVANCLCHNPSIGGTSLSAPVSAASLTNALAAHGRYTGVGDIHGALYSAYRNTHTLANTDRRKAVRDITAGQNGGKADKSTDPSVNAARGYDTVTGIGAVHWPAVMRFVFDKRTPRKPAVHFTEPQAHSNAWRTIRASWVASRGTDLRLLGATHVVVQRLGAKTTRANFYDYPASGARSFADAVPGTTYAVRVQASDLGHRRGPVALRTVRVPIDDSRLRHGTSWRHVANGGDIAGGHLATSDRGAALHTGGYGRAYAVRVHVGPHSGQLAVGRNGHRIKLINLHAARPGIRTIEFYSSSSRASRKFSFTDAGGEVTLDAVWITF